jgi:hypothetical protein
LVCGANSIWLYKVEGFHCTIDVFMQHPINAGEKEDFCDLNHIFIRLRPE